ncbi:MAG: GFA family protein [Myxococcota bacterium]|nr:GFA family protein [Myxococcota bacterium]
MTQTGRCHCGSVKYALDGEVPPIINCHCRDCRRVHGSAFVTTAPIPTRNLRILSGEAGIQQHDQRYFCRNCGTRLWNRLSDRPAATMLMVSTLDTEPTTPPVVHINTGSMAPWYRIQDDRPTFPALPPDSDQALDRLEKKT